MKNKAINKPKLHLTGKRNWINDPNGLIYYKGKYHMFYQHFPYAPQWGTMHWGHAISDDMVNWTYEPIALFPTKLYDRNGFFSGSAIEVNGDLYLYYTSVCIFYNEKMCSFSFFTAKKGGYTASGYYNITLLRIHLCDLPFDHRSICDIIINFYYNTDIRMSHHVLNDIYA